MRYRVINEKTNESHGVYDSFDEARGCVAYDGLVENYSIWALRASGEEICEWVRSDDRAEPEPSMNDEVLCCPDCERPNQFGELCLACTREQYIRDNQEVA